MMLDGYWKKELMSLKRQLRRWSNYNGDFLRDLASHKVNRAFLFSAIIIRKIVDDELDAQKAIAQMNGAEESKIDMPPFRILHHTVDIKYVEHVDKERFFVPHKVIILDYNTKNWKNETIPLNKLCSQFLHSYVWGLISQADCNRIAAVIFASDLKKEDKAYILRVDEWINAIDYVVENCSI